MHLATAPKLRFSKDRRTPGKTVGVTSLSLNSPIRGPGRTLSQKATIAVSPSSPLQNNPETDWAAHPGASARRMSLCWTSLSGNCTESQPGIKISFPPPLTNVGEVVTHSGVRERDYSEFRQIGESLSILPTMIFESLSTLPKIIYSIISQLIDSLYVVHLGKFMP